MPDNDWTLRLPAGVSLDFAPIGQDQFCVRAYGFGDAFNGPVGDAATRWLGQPAGDWFAARGLKLDECGIDPKADIHACPLFPVLASGESSLPSSSGSLRRHRTAKVTSPAVGASCLGFPRSRSRSR